MNIFLIGYRGTGKTTVANNLGEQLGWSSLDTDAEIQQRANKTIAQIFIADGEPVFRDWEMSVIKDLAAHDYLVISLGGGAILREQNRNVISGRGKTVWLRASPETIYERINADQVSAKQRPNLTAGGGLPEIREVLAQREPIYRQCADVTVDTEGKTPSGVTDEIIRLLKLEPTG